MVTEVSMLPCPPARSDSTMAFSDLDRCGIGVVADAFSSAEIDEARATVVNLAASEIEEGCSVQSFGTQRVFGLIQKAPIFRRMAVNPKVLALGHHILGPRMILYSMQANIIPQGGSMYAHFDQSEHDPLPPFPVVAAVVIMLEDFTVENGATIVAVGNFAKDLRETPPALEDMTPITGVKGTMSAYGGLLWHSSAINHTATPRCGILIHFCYPWIRQHENYQRTISAAMARDLTPEMRDLLGMHEHLFGRRWHSTAPEFRPRLVSPDE